MKSKIIQNMRGFTLIELIVVIGIIVVLAAIVLVAINPARQIGQANDARRASDVRAILDATSQYLVDTRGVYTGLFVNGTTPITPDTSLRAIGTAATGNGCNAATLGTPVSCINLANVLVPTSGSTYISAMPKDPGRGNQAGYPAGSDLNTRYTFQCTGCQSDGVSGPVTFTISAPQAQTRTVSVTR